MRTTTCARLVFFLSCLLPSTRAAGAGGPEQDLYEEKFISRAAERVGQRAAWAGKTDRAHWIKELEAAFPGKVGNPQKEEDYAAWYQLLAGDAKEWRRDKAPTKSVAELYDRVSLGMGLGPVPTIKQDEFMRYARNVLATGNFQNAQNGQGMNQLATEEADKVFRILDRDADGALTGDELTTKLREDKGADADGNGRIDKGEYRESYRRRVTASGELVAKVVGQGAFGDGGKGGLPGWLTSADTDEDGQIGLHEWRKAGKDILEFMKMDLNGDGLLTPDEYARFTKMKASPVPPTP